MKKLTAIYSVVLVLCFASFALAQAKSDISPTKKKLIAEIVSVTKADKKAEQSTTEFMKEMNKLYPTIVDSVVAGFDNLNESEKANLKREMLGKRQSFNKRFQEKLVEKISFTDLIEATIYPVYDKLFTEAELNDLLTFYKSPTGKKFMEVSPLLGSEVLKRTTQYLLPKVKGIMNEIKEEGF